jgi:YkoY family integral membrane protein
MAFLDTLVTDLGIIVTLVILEAVLSFDNAAILAALSRKLPLGEGRRRALNYGLAIAYVLRIGAILGAVVLLKFPVFITVGGAYLVFLSVKHFLGRLRGRGEEHRLGTGQPFLERFGLSPFTAVIMQIGVVDLAFAMDQVVAAVGFTRIYYLIIIAAGIGLLALRLLAPYLSRLMDWLPSLEDIAYVAVGFVGVLLLLESVGFGGGFHFVHHGDEAREALFVMPKAIKVGVTLALFLVPILVKLVFKWPKGGGPHHATLEESLREAGEARPSVKALGAAIEGSHGARVTEIRQRGKPTTTEVTDAPKRKAPAKRAPAKKPSKPAKKH